MEHTPSAHRVWATHASGRGPRGPAGPKIQSAHLPVQAGRGEELARCSTDGDHCAGGTQAAAAHMKVLAENSHFNITRLRADANHTVSSGSGNLLSFQTFFSPVQLVLRSIKSITGARPRLVGTFQIDRKVLTPGDRGSAGAGRSQTSSGLPLLGTCPFIAREQLPMNRYVQRLAPDAAPVVCMKTGRCEILPPVPIAVPPALSLSVHFDLPRTSP